MRGLIHLYCGDGKGKTTAAVGLSVRGGRWKARAVCAVFEGRQLVGTERPARAAKC